MLLLHHAAAHGDDLIGVLLFAVVKLPDIAENAHLRMLAHGAGVHDDDVGLELVLREAVAHLGEVAAQLLAVGLVLLAAGRYRPLQAAGFSAKRSYRISRGRYPPAGGWLQC